MTIYSQKQEAFDGVHAFSVFWNDVPVASIAVRGYPPDRASAWIEWDRKVVSMGCATGGKFGRYGNAIWGAATKLPEGDVAETFRFKDAYNKFRKALLASKGEAWSYGLNGAGFGLVQAL